MDRLKKTERMLRIWLLILRNPLRFTTRDLAEKFGVNVRTLYRDLDTLGTELRVPVYEDKAKWAVDDSYFLPPIQLTLSEALNVFLAARLMLSYSHRYDPNVDSTFSVLGSVLPLPLQEQVHKTLDWMRSLPSNETYISNLAKLAESWMSQHRVNITYRAFEAEKATERVIEPYFIEPAAAGHSSYVIAYCHRAREIRNFKIERINNNPSGYGDGRFVLLDIRLGKQGGGSGAERNAT
ncbi:MAG: WYL domain-containing protein [Candidatus Bathyarchaeota archaeon]